MATKNKTNAARILDQAGISYELREYAAEADEIDAVSVAHKIDLPPEQVFKTLVGRGERVGEVVACIPGDAELDLKKLAQVAGDKRVALVPVKEIQGLTGYVRGGVSPLGMRKTYSLYIHESATKLPRMSVSGGRRGVQILLAGSDLVRATDGRLADLVRR